jgi:glucosamine-6-phosphate deaminase
VNVRVLEDVASVAAAGAEIVAQEARERPELVFALPTGRTPLPMFDRLAALRAHGRLDLSRSHPFSLDELVLPPDDPRRFSAFLKKHAWSRLGIPEDRCAGPDTTARDLGAECRSYEERLAERGGLGLCVLGLGVDGHVAYNLPRPPSLDTHVRELPDAIAEENGVPPGERPLRAITLGLRTLAGSRRLLLLATGPSKATPVRMLATRFEDPDWPCSFLARHPNLTLLLDPQAAAQP